MRLALATRVDTFKRRRAIDVFHRPGRSGYGAPTAGRTKIIRSNDTTQLGFVVRSRGNTRIDGGICETSRCVCGQEYARQGTGSLNARPSVTAIVASIDTTRRSSACDPGEDQFIPGAG